MLKELILDVKIYIASFDEDIWINFVLLDDEFRCYAYNNLKQFVDLFTKVITEKDKTTVYLLGKLHSINDNPSIIYPRCDGWHYNGNIHRGNDLAAIIYKSGGKYWYNMNKHHRENDLPAIIYNNGGKRWSYNGLIHRDNDLPAVMRADGSKEWFINDICVRVLIEK